MDKQDLVNFLNEKGYVAEIIDGIPMVKFTIGVKQKDINELKDLIFNTNYKGSYGWETSSLPK